MGKVDSAALLNKINEQLARLGATGVPRLPKHHNRITRDEQNIEPRILVVVVIMVAAILAAAWPDDLLGSGDLTR
jgi:hypothetical protein